MKVTKYLIEESGYFWWNSVPLPPGQFAPESAVTGRLTIDEEGRTQLELNGVLPNEHGPLAGIIDSGIPLPSENRIHGILKNSNKAVRLLDLHRNGGRFKTNGISYEQYAALQCLVGDGPFRDASEPAQFTRLHVEMKGFEDWLRLRNVATDRSESQLTAAYQVPEKCSYKLSDAQLLIDFGISGPYLGAHKDSKLTLSEFAVFSFTPRTSLTLGEIKPYYELLADLLILLTGSDYNLDWPTLTFGEGKAAEFFRLYSLSHQSRTTEPPTWYESWAHFPQLRQNFGEIFSAFKRRREELGPSIYLYLATRRSFPMYEEHRFIMLVWGLESLNRRQDKGARGSQALQEKIARILTRIEIAKDKEWLERQLERSGEPALEQRLFEVLQGLPLGIREADLRRFCTECAHKRNDISHFGGRRHLSNYSSDLDDVHKKSEALSFLYHVLLLQQIGVDTNILRASVYGGFRAHRIKSTLVEVGLLPESALRDEASEQAIAAAKARANAQRD
jgi:hypothetical protein